MKHIVKVFYPTGRFFPTLALLLRRQKTSICEIVWANIY
jgi:hypothetical protein